MVPPLSNCPLRTMKPNIIRRTLLPGAASDSLA